MNCPLGMNWLCHDLPDGMNSAAAHWVWGNSIHGVQREIMPLCGNSRCAASIHFLVYPVGKCYASKVEAENGF
jgi:hypothetical protein